MDIIFTFDTTGSMSSVIAEVRHKLRQAAKDLFNNIPGLRIGAISHGDYCDNGRNYVVKALSPTNDLDSILAFFAGSGNTGGGDGDECYEYVLHRIGGMVSGDTRTVAVMVGDAAPHSKAESAHQIVKYRVDASHAGYNWREEAAWLGLKVYTIQCSRRGSFWAELASMTGGIHVYLDQFSNIVETLCAITYQQIDNEQVEQYAERLIAGGTFNRGLAQIIDTLLGEPTKFDPALYEVERRRPVGRFSRGIKSIPEGLVPVEPDRFQILNVGDKDLDVKSVMRRNGLVFRIGKVFYELRKSVLVQERKEVIVVDRETMDLYTGTSAREIIGLGYGKRGTVHPRDIKGNYTVFIQSTSANRKLLANTKFLFDMV